MPKVTDKEIIKSVRDHADQHASAPKRHVNRGLVAYTSDSPKRRQDVPGAFGKALAGGTAETRVKPNGSVVLAVDSRDRYWATLLKQVVAGARITVR